MVFCPENYNDRRLVLCPQMVLNDIFRRSGGAHGADIHLLQQFTLELHCVGAYFYPKAYSK